jgi:hypothetical protein
MCTWIKTSDYLPKSDLGPLLLWDAYTDDVGEVQIGFFDGTKFGVYEKDVVQLNITHWSYVTTPEE